MPKFYVLVSEATSGHVEVEAPSAEVARIKVRAQIDDGTLNGMEMTESKGYLIEDVQEVKE